MRSLTVTLPDHLVDAIEAKVAAGEYGSQSEVVQDALENFHAEDPSIESWLRDVVVPRCREHAAHPASLIPAEEVVDRVQRRYATRSR